MKKYFDIGFYQTLRDGYITFNNLTGRKYFFNPTKEPAFAYKKFIEEDPYLSYTSEGKEMIAEYEKSLAEIKRYSQNYRIQGSSGDMTKLACIMFYRQIMKRNLFGIVKIVNIVHDEILIETPEEMIEEMTELLVKCMEAAGNQFCKIIPLTAEPAIGDYWIH